MRERRRQQFRIGRYDRRTDGLDLGLRGTSGHGRLES
jgi:hypothetical protein